MKHLKLFIASLFLMLGMAVHAQQVEITKTDGTVEVFKPNEVDSVVYKPAPKFYYYAGWECPKTEEELAELVANADGTNAIGGTTTKLTGYSSTNTLLNIVTDIINPNGIQLDPYYIVVPNGINIYDVTLPNVPLNNTSFEDYISIKIDNYKIYKSRDGQYNVSGIQLY